MNKKLALRLALGLFTIAVLVLLYQYARKADIAEIITAGDTSGWIVATENLGDQGARAVAFKADGTKVDSADFKDGTEDQDVVWRPDGKFVFFAGNREGSYDVYRWNPDRNTVERRSYGSRGKTNLWFGPPGDPEANTNGLLTAGGLVLQFDPKDGSTRQILPPVMGEKPAGSAEDGGGSGSQFDLIYSRMGKSFRSAKWGKDRRWIVAVMVRESGDQLLMVQGTELVKGKDGSESFPPPAAVAAGERIDYDIAPDGTVVFTQIGFVFPDPDNIPKELLKNGAAERPYRHAIGAFNPDAQEKGLVIVTASKDDESCFSQPRFAPDSSTILFMLGKMLDTGEISPKGLFLIPPTADGGAKVRPVVQGEAREASWSPSGEKIVFIKRGPNGNRAIFTVSPDGTGEKEISAGKGDFAWPQFSPAPNR